MLSKEPGVERKKQSQRTTWDGSTNSHHAGRIRRPQLGSVENPDGAGDHPSEFSTRIYERVPKSMRPFLSLNDNEKGLSETADETRRGSTVLLLLTHIYSLYV